MPIYVWLIPALLLVWLAWTWNRLVAIRNAMRAAWASIDALLKRRADLIPNLVAVVRGGMDYEADTLTQVVHARNGVINATDMHDRARSEELLTGAYAVALDVSNIWVKQFDSVLSSSPPTWYVGSNPAHFSGSHFQSSLSGFHSAATKTLGSSPGSSSGSGGGGSVGGGGGGGGGGSW